MKGFERERREFLKLLGMGSGAALFGGFRLPQAFAKDVFPSDRILWIIPIKPGGGFDTAARVMSPYLTKYFKEISKEARAGDVVLKNVAEAGGARAYSNMFHAKPDGYTIGYFNAAFITESFMSKIETDCTKYTFLVRTHYATRVICTHKKSGFKTWEEMMKAGKEKELKWAASNFGRGHHVACILVKEIAKVPARLINFPGSAENANALIRGDVDMGINTQETAKPLIDAGEFRVLTTLSETSPYPGVPSITQLGYPELANPLVLHYFVIGPPNLPKEISNVLASVFKKVFSNNEFVAQAKKIEIYPDAVYGEDAERVAKGFFKFYEEKAPILKKYLM